MFIGQFEHTIDEKGRIAIPSKFRKKLKGEAIITKGLDGCLFFYSREKFTKMADSLGDLPLSKSSARLYSRLMLAGASEVSFDSQGRIIIPGYLRTFGKLKESVILVGLYDRVEIWDKSTWAKNESSADKKAEEIVEELIDFGI